MASRVRSARELATDILTRVDKDRAYSNLLLHQTLQKEKPERAEAALVTELVYGTVQRLNTIDYFLGRFVAKGAAKLDPWVRALLRHSFYQLHYLTRIPPHAAVNEAVNIAKKRGHAGIAGMVNGVLRSVLRSKDELVVSGELPAMARFALEHSHPEWMAARWVGRFGEPAAAAICDANNMPPKSSVRVNRLRRSPADMLRLLREAGYDAELSPLAPSGIVVTGGNMALTPWYADGSLSVQDESSMLVAEAVAPEPGMQVLDCCAAPGGKTAHLAELMQGKGRIVACDLHEHKIGLVREQAKRLGLRCVETVVADVRRLGERFAAGSFDRILLDAPCSGLGVIRRKPDLKWAKREAEIAELAQLQRELLEAVQALLAPGGVLVYSTCTLEAAENEATVQRFLREHDDFEPAPLPAGMFAPEAAARRAQGQGGEGDGLAAGADALRGAAVQLLPHEYGSDGFFIARLRRKG
ncbi:16S rRNA (cytosine(967)-C(5))-methyltransferase RsmB [Paenibacillus cymbidii]|uniref:16S rRNA (cytosine(967)-C(5))-methyltransferase RsmB n=1 Tax=Paenibacillus cymbidii TaxID=1639034 RepID=UPI001F28D414|nr:16S rRNA (cytosine(967)-C(5))-methyltransferase RsmB [Paenibacillus cymbidii]